MENQQMRNQKRMAAAGAVLVWVGLWMGVVYGEKTAFWEASRKEDYLAGRLVGLSVSDNGILRVVPPPRLVGDPQQPFAFCSVAVGREIYVGTGHDGKLFKIGADGVTTLVADFEELDVTALATDGKGTVFAATSPDGKIYRLRDEEASWQVAYDPPEKYIWAMCCLPDGTLVYATGAKGGVFALSSGATDVRSLLTTDELNVTSLMVALDGAIWAGTDPGGLVVRLAPDGQATAVFDAPAREIRQLVQMADGTVFALGIGEDKAGASGGEEAVGSSGEGAGGGAVRPAAGGTTLYRLGGDGRQTAVWTSPDAATVLMCRPDGLLVGLGSQTMGGQGRLFLVAEDGRAVLLGAVEEERIVAVNIVGDTLYVLTSGLAKLYRLRETAQDEGVFTSAVQDAKAVVEAWGRIVVEGTGEIFVQTRTGNTQTPGPLWSAWSAEMPVPGGGITSPKARFLQWRLRLKKGAEVRSVRAAYLPRNLPPTITSLTVLPVGVALQEAVVPPPDPNVMTAGLDPTQFGILVNQPPRKVFQRGARTLQWQAEDKNGDTLTYRLSYRLRGETRWKPLAGKLDQPFFVIAPEMLPDGTYEFQLEVSDAASNPPAFALTAVETLGPVVITNTVPKITFFPSIISAKEVKLQVKVTVTTEPPKLVEVAVNGNDWAPIYPDDLVLDSPQETFTLTYQNLVPGEYLVAVRVLDAALHTTSEKFVFVIRP